ncbi:hypothetical protein YTPLAS18_30900 [Nitrospira sp.]|nr:hypothetical protein YTPLAS18_30900 [Nitrospira sp.]
MRRMYVSVVAVGILLMASVPLHVQADSGKQSKSSTNSGGASVESVKFPPTDHCTTNEPCRTVTGEIVRIEESYWIQQPDGSEVHLTVTPETNIKGLPRVGDNIAAQLTSRGDAEAVVRLKELPEPGLDAPKGTYQEKRR